ncbi:MAG TPA: hypothetical protein VH206_15440 [Xanthobacteraceae bacterium]|nr:hypothetical protein [Xanthobacteraceae bacterium]
MADIKKDLPDWPDDVIEQWLLRLANRADTGWPPPEPFGDHVWKNILGNKPLSWWRKIRWKLEDHDITFEALSAASQKIVSEMLAAHINGARNVYSVWPESKVRFLSLERYVAQHGTYPKPPVAMRLNDGLRIIDGNHRVTVLCCRQAASKKVLKSDGVTPIRHHQIWVGSRMNGEL